MIRLLPNPEFLPWLLRAISKARKRIVLVNYLTALGEGDRHGPVRRVVDALVAARRRGVKVEVVLEGSKFRENYAFYRVLKDAGADAWMDTSLTFIHTKALLIDDRILCVGSHNLSASALTAHHEISAAFRDPAAVKRFRAELARMTEQKRRIGDAICRAGAKISMAPLVAIKRSASPHAYLLYLLLCRIDGGKPRPIPVDAAGWADELGFPSSIASANVRIASILDLLSRKLKVVRIDRHRGTVTRMLPQRRGGVIARSASDKAISSGQAILLPSTFWKYGWHRRLSMEAIHLYLAGEAETIESPFAPWWRLKRDEIAARHGFQKQLVNRAQMELRRAGLLEIIFESGKAPKGMFVRQMNYFRENPFYDRAALERKMREIAGRYSPAVFSVASRLLAVICEDSDLEKLAAACGLVSKRGVAASRRALASLRRLSPNSTRRHFGYVQELLGSIAAHEEG